jgi:hypothetical protein
MLEADLAELAAGSTSELGLHLGSCPACRSAAAEVVQAQRALAAWLSEARPRGDAGAAVARAAAAGRRRAGARRLGVAGSVLAAAAVAALLLLPRRQLPPAALVATALPEAGAFSVSASPGTNLVVMHTSNPKIVVVWYLPSRRTS